MTAGKGLGGGAESAGAVAAVVSLAAGAAFVVGLPGDSVAWAGCSMGIAGDWRTTGSAVTASSRVSGGNGGTAGNSGRGGGVGVGEGAGCASMSVAGESMTRRSGASTRRSCQGKAKPGRPNSSPPKLRLNNNAWTSRETRSGSERRRPWWLSRRTGGCGAAPDCMELTRTPPSRSGLPAGQERATHDACLRRRRYAQRWPNSRRLHNQQVG